MDTHPRATAATVADISRANARRIRHARLPRKDRHLTTDSIVVRNRTYYCKDYLHTENIDNHSLRELQQFSAKLPATSHLLFLPELPEELLMAALLPRTAAAALIVF